jgi:hypothetical protein
VVPVDHVVVAPLVTAEASAQDNGHLSLPHFDPQPLDHPQKRETKDASVILSRRFCNASVTP